MSRSLVTSVLRSATSSPTPRVASTSTGLRLAVVRIGDDWYAIADRCSHADESLSEGDVWAEEREIECPKHGSTFSLLTGEPQTLPATRRCRSTRSASKVTT